jgi:hypothetical protein
MAAEEGFFSIRVISKFRNPALYRRDKLPPIDTFNPESYLFACNIIAL